MLYLKESQNRAPLGFRGEPELLKKSPVIADENTKCFWKCFEQGSGVFIVRDVLAAVRRLAVEMGRGTGDDFETRRAIDIIFLIFNLPARHGNVERYRQYDRR